MLALKALLLEHQLSQRWLAVEVGLSQTAISLWLNKGMWPTAPGRTSLIEAATRALLTKDIAVDAAFFELPTAVDAADKLEDITMLLKKQSLSPAAKKHFGLFRDPFTDEINSAEDVFSSPGIRNVREHLWTTAKFGGFIAVVGESGAGKTTLRKDIEERIMLEDAPIILIQPYVLGMEDNDRQGKTLKSSAIADALIVTIQPNATPKSSMEAKSRQLHKILKDSRRAGFSHCLIIEEAHALHAQTLKHLKRFMELEDGFKKLLSIVLIGQSELKNKLSERSPEVREVVQRCEVIDLPPLDAQLESYLQFKFSRIGAELDSVFEKSGVDAIRDRLVFSRNGKSAKETVSLLFPLMVNNLVTAALNQAESLGFNRVSGDLVREI